jgi:catechol 2,3-dioxygenase
MIRPTLNHLNLKTTRLKEMIDWYSVVIGGKITFQSAGSASTESPIQIAFMANDRAPFRIAFMAIRGLQEDPDQFVHAGLHHIAFEAAKPAASPSARLT